LIVLGPEEPFHAVERRIRQQRGHDALNAKGNFRFERELRQWRSGYVLDLRLKR
jgi:hypothetical protein